MKKSALTQEIITNKSQLSEIFKKGIKNKANFKIGLEQEKIGVDSKDFLAVPYNGRNGVLEFLKNYKEKENDWKFWPDSNLILGLENSVGMITLEPGSQLEFSSTPQNNIHEIKSNFEQYTKLSSDIAEEMGIFWIGYGIQPLSIFKNINQIPKDRYKIMAEYLPTKADLPFVMMRESAGIQTAIDYESEEDCMRKLKISLALSPIVTAMFANSPIRNGQDSGYKSYRALGWLNVDEDRCGLISKKIFKLSHEELSFDDYVDVLLDLPMIFLEKDNKWFNMQGLTFKQYLKEGHSDYQATIDDWQLHMTSFFPDIRLKSYLEIRNCDCQKSNLALALPALWKGIMYSEDALNESWELVKDFTWEDTQELRKAVPKLGIEASIKNKKILDLSKELVKISRDSLDIQAKLSHINSESIYLDQLQDLLNQGKSPADKILEHWNGDWNKDLSKLVDYSRLK